MLDEHRTNLPDDTVGRLLGGTDGVGLRTVEASRPKLIPTGFDMLDRSLYGGIRQGDLNIVGGRPGAGKTVLTLQWARNMALDGYHAIYLCFEHDQHSLLGRLLALEVGEYLAEGIGTDGSEVAKLLREIARGEWHLDSPAGSHPLVRAAMARIHSYGDRLTLITGDRTHTLAMMDRLLDAAPMDKTVLFVDYLQRVPVDGEHSPAEATAIVAQGLKELALDAEVPIVAVSKLREGALSSRRLRLRHLAGTETIAYEADLVLMLNDKGLVVSKVHHAFDSTRIKEFERRVVFSVEKNRSGESGMHVEFDKDFAHFRFQPDGSFTSETLIDEVVILE